MSATISTGSGAPVGVDVRDVKRIFLISFTRVLIVTLMPAPYVAIGVFDARYSALWLEVLSASSAEKPQYASDEGSSRAHLLLVANKLIIVIVSVTSQWKQETNIE